MNDALETAFAPVYRDLRASCPVLPAIERSDDHPQGPGLWLKEPDGSGLMITIAPGIREADQIARLADLAQEWAVEALWSARLPATWPTCPAHPGTHPLTAGVTNDQAVWCCPRTGDSLAPIGHLPENRPGRNP